MLEALHLSQRLRVSFSGVDLDEFGLGEILDANDYSVEVGLGELDSLVHSCTFEIVARRRRANQAQVISQRSTLDATASGMRSPPGFVVVGDGSDERRISGANLFRLT